MFPATTNTKISGIWVIGVLSVTFRPVTTPFASYFDLLYWFCRRKEEPAFRSLHFILSLSSAGVLCCHLIWFLDVPISLVHLLLSIAEHYLWFVSSLSSLTLNAVCCKVVKAKSRAPSVASTIEHQQTLSANLHTNMTTDSLADQYLIIFVIPLLFMAPLPFVECFAIHK